LVVWAACASAAFPSGSASAQFLDDFPGPVVALDPQGVHGWRYATGDGAATMELRQGVAGLASILVDATRDRRGIWWALIERDATRGLDLARLQQPGAELRIEARIRVSHAPRRVNLQLRTQRTTDYHSQLMEFDIPDERGWHTIAMTTHGFEARPGDAVVAHLALMDWGLEQYRVDVDYIKVEVVDAGTATPDLGAAVPYHPPVADPRRFTHSVKAAADGMIDLEHRDVRMGRWRALEGGRAIPLRTVDGTHVVILRWDLSAFAGRRVASHGQLELTTRSVERSAEDFRDFGQVRVVEILSGDPRWDGESVTTEILCQGQPLTGVLNPQPIIDWPVSEGEGAKTYFTIGNPVLQRLVDGRTLGIAIQPLGAIHAAFRSGASDGGRYAPVLRFDLAPHP
jgi:hypothetical protein